MDKDTELELIKILRSMAISFKKINENLETIKDSMLEEDIDLEELDEVDDDETKENQE